MNTTPSSSPHHASTTESYQPASEQATSLDDTRTREPASGGTALVLGGGGSTGNAWLIGVIAGLFDGGLDATTADLTIGTSAGSTTAAQISGANPTDLFVATVAAVPPQQSGPPRSSRAGAASGPVVNQLRQCRPGGRARTGPGAVTVRRSITDAGELGPAPRKPGRRAARTRQQRRDDLSGQQCRAHVRRQRHGPIPAPTCCSRWLRARQIPRHTAHRVVVVALTPATPVEQPGARHRCRLRRSNSREHESSPARLAAYRVGVAGHGRERSVVPDRHAAPSIRRTRGK